MLVILIHSTSATGDSVLHPSANLTDLKLPL